MSHRKRGHYKILPFKKWAGFNLIQAERHGRLVAAQDNSIQQVMNAIERGTPAEDIQFIDRLPAQERGHQPAQPENMIEMTMCKQYACKVLEASARLQDLTLRAFTAIDQKTIFIVFDDLCGKTALCRGCRCRSAKKEYFKQIDLLC